MSHWCLADMVEDKEAACADSAWCQQEPQTVLYSVERLLYNTRLSLKAGLSSSSRLPVMLTAGLFLALIMLESCWLWYAQLSHLVLRFPVGTFGRRWLSFCSLQTPEVSGTVTTISDLTVSAVRTALETRDSTTLILQNDFYKLLNEVSLTESSE